MVKKPPKENQKSRSGRRKDGARKDRAGAKRSGDASQRCESLLIDLHGDAVDIYKRTAWACALADGSWFSWKRWPIHLAAFLPTFAPVREISAPLVTSNDTRPCL